MRAGAPASARVVVAQSYFLRFDPKLLQAGQPVPPLGSLICAAVLRERGFEVAFFDAMLASSEEECARVMDRHPPSCLVLFEDSFNYLTKMCLGRMREAAAAMIGMARARGVDVIVAGSDASDDPRFFLEAGASAVAVGEAEFAVADWLEAGRLGAGSIAGIVTLARNGEIAAGPARSVLTDLDAIPPPAWDLIDLGAYRSIWTRRQGFFSMPLATSRGCPYHCNWCAKPIWGQRYNAQSPARAASEVLALKRMGATHLNVVDDIFGLKPGWLREFSVELSRLDAVLPFRCLSRADLLTDPYVLELAMARCEMVWIGAESGSQKILDAMEKGVTVAEIRQAAARLRSSGIKVGLFLQFGYPGESEDDVEATLAMVDEVWPDDIGISVSYPLPGTPFHARVREEMKRARNWRDSSDLAMLFGGTQQTAYYRRLHAYTHARFRLGRALRSRQGGWPQRAFQASRYALARMWFACSLALSARDRVRIGLLPVRLTRAGAATPGPGPGMAEHP